MKRVLLALCIIYTSFLVGCSDFNKNLELGNSSDEILHYVMDIGTENNVFLPLLEIDKSDQTFSITNDVLSSTIIGGTYRIKGNILITETHDKQDTYQFEIIDGNTLKFIQDHSSAFKLIDERVGILIVDGSIFKLQSK